MSDKKILVSGKEIDYGNFSDEKLLSLYNQLIQRQDILVKKAERYIESAHVEDIDINNISI